MIAGYILAYFVAFSAVVLSAQIIPRDGPAIPKDLANRVRADLAPMETQECLAHERVTLDRVLATERLDLDSRGIEALLVQGLAPCLAGANNGDVFIYAKLTSGWRQVFSGNGSGIQLRDGRSRGWRDFEFWQHSSAFESVRYVYRFDGNQYKAVACDVQLYDSQNERLPPTYLQCGFTKLKMDAPN